MQARALLVEMFGGKVPRRSGNTNAGERPYLVARNGVSRSVLLEAAADAAGSMECGSGGVMWCVPGHPRPLRRKWPPMARGPDGFSLGERSAAQCRAWPTPCWPVS